MCVCVCVGGGGGGCWERVGEGGTGGVDACCTVQHTASCQLPAAQPANPCPLQPLPAPAAPTHPRALTFLRACWNMSRTREAPTPTNISMNSVPAAGRAGQGGVERLGALCEQQADARGEI